MLSILPPGMPFITYNGPSPALREDAPLSWILGDEFGSAVEVLVTDKPATLPCSDIRAPLPPTVSRSLEFRCVIELDTSFLLSVPYPTTTTSLKTEELGINETAIVA